MDVKLNWIVVNEIRNEFDSLNTGESKHQFCIRKGKQYKISDVEIRRIINNQRWKELHYEPYMPGKNLKLNIYDVRDIRKAFINKSPDISVKQFVELWSLHKNVSKSQIHRIIYNKSWNDVDYEPPKYRRKSNNK